MASIFDAIFGFRVKTDTKIVDNQNFTISSFAGGYRNPFWVCRYPVADVSYPETLNFDHVTFGDTGAASTGTAHTHDMDFARVAPTLLGIGEQSCIGAYLTITNTTVMDTVGLIVNKASGTLNNTFLEIFRENSDGSLSRRSSTDISSSITTSVQFLEIPISGGVIAQAGERYLVRLRNDTSTTTDVSVRAIITNDASPQVGFRTSGASLTNQTSYTSTEAATARTQSPSWVPWVFMAAKNLAEPDVSYSDDANRANLGPFWVTSGTDDIVIADSQFAYGGTTDGDEAGLYIRRTSGDASKVSADLHLDLAGSTQQEGVRLHCDREGTQCVELAVSVTDAKIYSYASGTPTEQATVSVGGSDTYSLYYDEPNDKYVALKAGAEFGLEWTGVSTAVAHGDRYRFGGIRISRDSSVNAGTLDNWTLSDFVA